MRNSILELESLFTIAMNLFSTLVRRVNYPLEPVYFYLIYLYDYELTITSLQETIFMTPRYFSSYFLHRNSIISGNVCGVHFHVVFNKSQYTRKVIVRVKLK